MVPDPLPLAYAVYTFINVDNCERPLNFGVILQHTYVATFLSLHIYMDLTIGSKKMLAG